MAIDPYVPCPCGSGKKLKFCCSDLALEIEKIHKMVAGDQPHAALQHVEQLLLKDPERSSLLDLRATLELSMTEVEAARKTIEKYLAAHPESASAHAQATILAAAADGGSQAIAPLQNALERLEDDMPQRVLEAIGATGHALLMDGDIVAARGHLLLYASIAPKGDNQALELLLRMNLEGGLPLLLRDYLLLAECPADVAWAERFRESLRLAQRGTWRRAEAGLAQLRDEFGAEPEIVFNLALLRGWLGQTERLASGLHEYAAGEYSRPFAVQFNAIEAEAVSQLVDPALEDPTFDTVRLEYPIVDEDALTQRLASDGRMIDYPQDPNSDDAAGEIRPRSSHLLLDRPIPDTGVDIPREDVPQVLSFVSVYGKRTDCDAQLEVTTDRNDTFAQVKALVEEIAGDTLGPLTEEEVIAQKSYSEDSLSWRWRLPPDTPPAHRRQLLSEQRRIAILQRWPAAGRAALGGKSSEEAAGDDSLTVALQASVLILEQAAVEPTELPLFDDLLEKLQLPPAQQIDPTDLDLEHVPLVRVARMDLSKLDDLQLARLLTRTSMVGANLAALSVAGELAGRESVDEGVDLSQAYRELIRLDPNPDNALQWIEKARQYSASKNETTAPWTLLELELAIERSDAHGVHQVLNDIRENHLEEEGVAKAAYQLLYSAGLVAPPGEATPPPAATPSSELWTPGSDAPAVGEKKSALWTPS